MRTSARSRRSGPAGGIVVGKTNTPEFGAGANTVNPVYGATGNPFDPEKTCAGSSGGSAVALATGMVPLATGSDMGGSLRNPAAYCGVVGFRPSPGAVPHEPRLIGWSPLSVQGAMGRTVADTALLHGVMAAATPAIRCPGPRRRTQARRPVDLGSLRVAISEDLGFAPLDDGIRETFRAARAARGVFAPGRRARSAARRQRERGFEINRAVSFLAAHGDTYRSRRGARAQPPRQCRAGPRDEPRGGGARDAAHTELYRAFLDFMTEYDALICPAMAVPPFPHRQRYVEAINGQRLRTYFHWLALAYGLTLTAHPVACIPCGRDHTGMPFGIQVCGRRFGDRRTLAIAAALEAHLQTIPELARPLPDLARLAAADAQAPRRHEPLDLLERGGALGEGEGAALPDLLGGAQKLAERGARERRAEADPAHAERRQLLDRERRAGEAHDHVDGLAQRRADRPDRAPDRAAPARRARRRPPPRTPAGGGWCRRDRAGRGGSSRRAR